MKSCITCGMPLEGEHEKDLGFVSADGPVCQFDSKDGKIKSGDEVFNGGIEFFAQAVTGGDKTLAAKLTRKNMKSLPYWQKHHFAELDGEEATDAEFSAAMAKM